MAFSLSFVQVIFGFAVFLKVFYKYFGILWFFLILFDFLDLRSSRSSEFGIGKRLNSWVVTLKDRVFFPKLIERQFLIHSFIFWLDIFIFFLFSIFDQPLISDGFFNCDFINVIDLGDLLEGSLQNVDLAFIVKTGWFLLDDNKIFKLLWVVLAF